MKIAIIIARGNSSRIKNKNIKFFFGEPIIKKTFTLIKSFKIFDKIILSTDSGKIINVCKNLGFNQIIIRPKKLGKNEVSTNKVVNHTIDQLNYQNKIKYMCCVYPCSPLIEKKNILKSFKLLKTNKDFIFPLLEFPEPIEQALRLLSNNKLEYISIKDSKKNTQLFSKKYYDSGQFYTSTIFGWRSKKKTLKGFVLPKYSTVDIDDVEDWNFAKYLFFKKNGKN
ncbi:hypothetical protein IDH30_05635 [Pelagibacterales bacterium SAG-MED15]|nr:hypothetical protein [Pelagibacterales bacterium SAG-MED15]